MGRPFIWQMIKEAVSSYPGGKATYSEIKDYIWKKYPDVKDSTINAQAIVCTVNQPSRVQYPENKKPRIANSRYDFLFTVGRGKVVLYNPEEHGVWEIRKDDYDRLIVAQVDAVENVDDEEEVPNACVALH